MSVDSNGSLSMFSLTVVIRILPLLILIRLIISSAINSLSSFYCRCSRGSHPSPEAKVSQLLLNTLNAGPQVSPVRSSS